MGSPVNYDVSVEIQWKDQEKAPVALYLMEDDSLTDIIDQVKEQNTD